MGRLSILITGAGGYVGRAAVAEARRVGHQVFAQVRGPDRAPQDWSQDPGITPVVCDLVQADGSLAEACAAADCVVHCAAAMTGDDAAQARDTQEATRVLLGQIPAGGKLVHVSSMAVYDYNAMDPGTIVTEEAPIDHRPAARDAYARAKIAQEQLVSEMADARTLRLTILRPGAVFGPGRLWNAHLGTWIGPVLLRFGRRGQIPLAHIALTAEALVRAAESRATSPINVLDEDLPDRVRYLACLHGPDAPKLIVPLPAALLAPLQSSATRAARYRPFGFDATRLRNVLDVHQHQGFETLMHEAQDA